MFKKILTIFIFLLFFITNLSAEMDDKDNATLDDLKALCKDGKIKSMELSLNTKGTKDEAVNAKVKELSDLNPSGIWYYCSESEQYFHSYIEIKNSFPSDSYTYYLCIHGKVNQPGNMKLQEGKKKGLGTKIFSDAGNTDVENEANRGYCNYGQFTTDNNGNANILTSVRDKLDITY